MMKKIVVITLLLCITCASSIGSNVERGVRSINRRAIEAQLRFLASDSLRGRAAGSVEAAITADYITSVMYGEQYDVQQQRFFLDSVKTKQGRVAVGWLNNLLFQIQGKDTTKTVVVGAHYDHLGVTKTGEVYNGADDNASGVVAVLQIARAFREAGIKPKYNVLFAFWDGEEIGSLGSKHYIFEASHHSINVKGYMNFDMIGRNTDESRPTMFRYLYTESSAEFERYLREAITTYNLRLDPEYRAWDNPTTGSDNAPFAKAGIPIVWFHTDAHPDYHKVTDTAEKINYDKLTDIIRAAFVVVVEMAK